MSEEHHSSLIHLSAPALVEAEAASAVAPLNNGVTQLREQIWKQQEVVSGFLLRLAFSNVV